LKLFREILALSSNNCASVTAGVAAVQRSSGHSLTQFNVSNDCS